MRPRRFRRSHTTELAGIDSSHAAWSPSVTSAAADLRTFARQVAASRNDAPVTEREGAPAQWPELLLTSLRFGLVVGQPAPRGVMLPRSAERRVGEECVRTCRSRCSTYH